MRQEPTDAKQDKKSLEDSVYDIVAKRVASVIDQNEVFLSSDFYQLSSSAVQRLLSEENDWFSEEIMNGYISLIN